MESQFIGEGIDLPPSTQAALVKQGICQPTPVQSRAMPLILAGRDVMVQSATGTGKTLAYVLPLMQRAAADPTFRVVIMAPSPELAMQIVRTVESIKPAEVACVGLVGSGNIDRQKDRLKKHPQFMVGTPGRVLELWLARKIKTAQVSVLVLDEVDEILAPQIARPLGEICSRPEFTAQLVYASATLGERAHAFAQRFMDDDYISTHVVGAPATPTIEHYGWSMGDAADKEEALLYLLRSGRVPRALVFVNKLYLVSHLYNLLQECDIPCSGLSAERTKQSRETTMRAFRSGELRVLIATDAAARGLDIADLEWVVHYDLPQEPEAYVHRSGRVGRAGKQGVSLGFVGPRDGQTIKRYRSALGVELQGFAP